MHACFLMSTYWRVSCWAHWHGANCEDFFVEMGVGFNSDLLAETDDIVSAKDVHRFKALEHEY